MHYSIGESPLDFESKELLGLLLSTLDSNPTHEFTRASMRPPKGHPFYGQFQRSTNPLHGHMTSKMYPATIALL